MQNRESTMKNAGIFSALVVMICIAGCTTNTKTSEVQPEPLPPGHQQAKNANVFAYKGQFEKDSSFKRRQAAAARADKFFAKLGEDQCLIRDGMEQLCYKIANEELLQIYNEGVSESQVNWKRLHNTICISGYCRPLTAYKIQLYAEYAKNYRKSPSG